MNHTLRTGDVRYWPEADIEALGRSLITLIRWLAAGVGGADETARIYRYSRRRGGLAVGNVRAGRADAAHCRTDAHASRRSRRASPRCGFLSGFAGGRLGCWA